MSLFEELKRRNVFRVGIAYVVIAWVLLQMVDFALDLISAPNWVMQVFFLAALVILPLVLVFSWVFEMTPEGIVRESEIDRSQSVTQNTGRKLDRTIIVFLGLAVVLLLADRFIAGRSATQAPPTTVAKEEVVDATPDDGVKSIAVLPFVNMSSDPEQEYFSDGLSEELLNRLAQNPQLQVAARTSAFQFKGKNLDISDIGRQLNVANILEGSVRKSGNRLRITAQLIRVDNGYHLWSQTFDREIDDIFAIQDDISTSITLALEAELGASPVAENNQPTENLEAYQLYLEARFLLAKRGEANMLKANDLFEKAVGLDPKFSKAWSGLAYNFALLPSYGSSVSTRQSRDKVKIASGKAIELDPANAEAYVALARGGFYDDFKTIQSNFKKAFELAPNNADVLNLYADFMVETGDFNAAERLEQKAIELDPLAAVHYSDMAFVMFPLGRFEEGLAFGRTSASLAVDSIDRSDALVLGLIFNGQYEEAIKIIQIYEDQPGSNAGFTNMWWCQLYYHQGNEQKLREKVNERIQQSDAGQGSFYYTYTAYFIIWLDGMDAAMPWLEKAYEENEWTLTWPDNFYLPERISDDPNWLAFWKKPRLAELIEIRRSNGPYENLGYMRERK